MLTTIVTALLLDAAMAAAFYGGVRWAKWKYLPMLLEVQAKMLMGRQDAELEKMRAEYAYQQQAAASAKAPGLRTFSTLVAPGAPYGQSTP